MFGRIARGHRERQSYLYLLGQKNWNAGKKSIYMYLAMFLVTALG
jgi:hypothetical protein